MAALKAPAHPPGPLRPKALRSNSAASGGQADSLTINPQVAYNAAQVEHGAGDESTGSVLAGQKGREWVYEAVRV